MWTTISGFPLQAAWPAQSAAGASRHVGPRSSLAFSLKGVFTFRLFTLARVLSRSLGAPHGWPARRAFSTIFPMPVSTGIHASVPDGSSEFILPLVLFYGTSHPTSTRGPSTYFPEDSCEDNDEEEGHCTDGQITDSTVIANTPGLRAEGRWPWLRSLVAFPCRARVVSRTPHVSCLCVKSFFLFCSLFFPGVFNWCHADT